MGLVLTCSGCGTKVFGVASSLRKIDGRYFCPTCASNPSGTKKYYCNSCHNYSAYAGMKGNTGVELFLYFLYIVPGLIYSTWRRSGKPNVCLLCNTPGLVLAEYAKPCDQTEASQLRDEVECPYCAEKILAKAKFCKYCNKQVRY
jgi:DNA-directed RNA polymerase subunit RPC12/RpoP